MVPALSYVVFTVDSQRYALPLPAVERVVSACEVRPVRNLARRLLGVVDLAGDVVPVLDAAADPPRERAIGPDDLFLVVNEGDRRAVILVDTVEGVRRADDDGIRPIDDRARVAGGPTATWSRDGDLVLVHAVGALLDGEVIEAVRRATTGST